MDATELLKKDHRELQNMLKDLGGAEPRKRERLLKQVKQELTVHETIEEEIFYPALQEHPKAKEMALEAFEEHNVVDTIMGELEATPVDDETWDAKFIVMEENIKHHIEQEENELFKKARQIFDREELREMGTRMEERKREVKESQQAA